METQLWVIPTVSTERTVKIEGIGNLQLKLSRAKGMVWCMPIFDNIDDAKEYWVALHWDDSFEIRSITVGSDYSPCNHTK